LIKFVGHIYICFFKSRILPEGIKLSFNLAVGVNDPNLVFQIQSGKVARILFNPDNRRRKDNMTGEQRNAMNVLRNLPNTSNAQVTFKNKGLRFVLRHLDYQNNAILDQLSDQTHFDELDSDPTARVRQ
jgi:hypothetical protein